MALGHRARAISRYGGGLYDLNHALVLFDAARTGYDNALSDTAEWDEDEHSLASPTFRDGRDEIDSYLKKMDFDDNYDLNQWSLGDSETERHYRHWCLHKRMFLNPLNDVTTLSGAATDVLHLPDHTYKVGEVPRFVGFYNLLKQEYVNSRYHLYCSMNETALDFLNRDVKLFDIGDGNVYGHHTEELKSAFRSAYAIFDKIGLFLNDYYAIGLRSDAVSFRGVWSEKPKGAPTYQLRQVFVGKENWPLRGLYSLSKDLYDDAFKDAAEPDAARLSELRNQIEHRFLSLHYLGQGMPAGTHVSMASENVRLSGQHKCHPYCS